MSEPKRWNVPRFSTEAEEAAWWYEHREEHDDLLIQAIEAGTARRRTHEERLAEWRAYQLAQTVPDRAEAADEAERLQPQAAVPRFATEAEEANWWYENREALGEEFLRAREAGQLQHGTARRFIAEARARRARGEVIIKLDTPELARVEEIAAREGVAPAIVLQRLVRDALAQSAGWQANS